MRKLPAQLLVIVTKDDIDRGKPGDCDSCPIALSVMRDMGDKFAFGADVSVGNSTMRVVTEHDVKTYQLPEQARKFIYWLDGDQIGEFEPFGFVADEVPND